MIRIVFNLGHLKGLRVVSKREEAGEEREEEPKRATPPRYYPPFSLQVPGVPEVRGQDSPSSPWMWGLGYQEIHRCEAELPQDQSTEWMVDNQEGQPGTPILWMRGSGRPCLFTDRVDAPVASTFFFTYLRLQTGNPHGDQHSHSFLPPLFQQILTEGLQGVHPWHRESTTGQTGVFCFTCLVLQMRNLEPWKVK